MKAAILILFYVLLVISASGQRHVKTGDTSFNKNTGVNYFASNLFPDRNFYFMDDADFFDFINLGCYYDTDLVEGNKMYFLSSLSNHWHRRKVIVDKVCKHEAYIIMGSGTGEDSLIAQYQYFYNRKGYLNRILCLNNKGDRDKDIRFKYSFSRMETTVSWAITCARPKNEKDMLDKKSNVSSYSFTFSDLDKSIVYRSDIGGYDKAPIRAVYVSKLSYNKSDDISKLNSTPVEKSMIDSSITVFTLSKLKSDQFYDTLRKNVDNIVLFNIPAKKQILVNEFVYTMNTSIVRKYCMHHINMKIDNNIYKYSANKYFNIKGGYILGADYRHSGKGREIAYCNTSRGDSGYTQYYLYNPDDTGSFVLNRFDLFAPNAIKKINIIKTDTAISITNNERSGDGPASSYANDERHHFSDFGNNMVKIMDYDDSQMRSDNGYRRELYYHVSLHNNAPFMITQPDYSHYNYWQRHLYFKYR